MQWIRRGHRHDTDGNHSPRCHERRFAREEGGGRRGHRHGHGPDTQDTLHGGHEGGHEGRRGRGGSRLFDHGVLRIVLLHLLSEKPRHGYELIKEIEERLAGAYSPSPGVIYPTLTLLEEINHIAVVNQEGPRKQFTLTEEGAAHLAANATILDHALARMAEARARHAVSDAPQLVRALENHKLALRLRLKSGNPAPTAIEAIAAILDRAAGEIERT